MENLICVKEYSNIKPNTICNIDQFDNDLLCINQLFNYNGIKDNRCATILKDNINEYFNKLLSLIELLNIIDINFKKNFNIIYFNRSKYSQIHIKSNDGFVIMNLHQNDEIIDYMDIVIKTYDTSKEPINMNKIFLTTNEIEHTCDYIKSIFSGGGMNN